MRYEDQKFAGQTVHSDGNHYVRCDFTDTKLEYGGGPMPYFDTCIFTRTHFSFVDAADRTIAFLRGLASDRGNGAEIVRVLLELDGEGRGRFWSPGQN